MSISSATTNDYSYMDEAFRGENQLPRYQSKNSRPTESAENSAISANNDNETADNKEDGFFGDDGFGFDDFLDIINPLQHLPVISAIYREITGDEISPGARVIGGGIFGGGIGLASSIVNTAIEAETGKDLGGHVIALFDGDDDASEMAVAATPLSDVKTASAANTAVTAALPVSLSPEEPAAPYAMNAALTTTTKDSQANPIAPAAYTNALPENPALQLGLQWKGAAPDLHKSIENAKGPQGGSLSDAQMAKILDSFRGGSTSPTPSPVARQPADLQNPGKIAPNERHHSTESKAATAVYEKQNLVQPKPEETISDSFDYLNKLV